MDVTKTKPAGDLLSTKKHYEILDGVRGVAAIAVVIFHFMEIAISDPSENFIAHAYLAVDLFFCLSGFVIAYAYDNRIQKIGTATFFKLRLIRLHPLVVVGSIIGLLTFIFDPYSSLYLKYADRIGYLFVTSCFMIPYPIVPERFFNLFHLNPPTWSLFWEYVINIVYAFVLVKIRNKTLWIITILAAIVLCYESHKAGSLIVGWSRDTFPGGGVRVCYSFIAGILVYRSKYIISSKLGFLPIALLSFFMFLVPYNNQYNWLVDPFIVIFCFPLLVALGAGARLRPFFSKLCKFSGDISYPLYMVHYPVIWIFLSYVEKEKPSMHQMLPIIIIGTILLIVFAYIIMRVIDIPVRNYLKSHLKKL